MICSVKRCRIDWRPAVVSVGVVAFFIVPFAMLRNVCQRKVSDRYQNHAIDFLATFSLVGCTTEFGHMMHYYGKAGFAGVILLVSLGFWRIGKQGYIPGTSNPCTYLERYLQGRYPAGRAATLVVAQIAGGIAAMQLVRCVQDLGLTDYHHSHARSGCVSDLNVPLAFGFFVEAAGVVLGDITDDVTLVQTDWLNVVLKTLVDVGICLYGTFL